MARSRTTTAPRLVAASPVTDSWTPTKLEPQPEAKKVAEEIQRLQDELAGLPAQADMVGANEDKMLELLVKERTLPHKIAERQRRLLELEEQSAREAIAKVSARHEELRVAVDAAWLVEHGARRDRERTENAFLRCNSEMRRFVGIHAAAQRKLAEDRPAESQAS